MLASAARSCLDTALWKLIPRRMESSRAVAAYGMIKSSGIAFIHIPKAAGMSLSEAIYGQQIGHLTWRDVWRSNPKNYERILSFSVCRNPFDRFVSAFNFLKSGGINDADLAFSTKVLSDIEDASDLARRMKFDEFRAAVQRKVHFRPQVEFVCRRGGEVMVDHLVSFDRISTDVPRILGWDEEAELPHANRGVSRGGEEDLSDDARAVLAHVYREDIRLWEAMASDNLKRGERISRRLQA